MNEIPNDFERRSAGSQRQVTAIPIGHLVDCLSLAEVVGQSVALTKNGDEYRGLCPFHEEKTPSFTVYKKNGRDKFKCFGCQAQGDVVDFLTKSRGLSVIEAKDELRRLVGGGTAEPSTATKKPAAVKDKRDDWSTVYPAPEEIPTRVYSPKTDKETNYRAPTVYTYRDATGALLGYVFRIDKKGGGKITLQISYCENKETGDLRWCARHFDPKRPLYGLDKLKPAGTVLIVEGEKCVDAAQRLFPNVSVVTWPGGTNAAKYSNWLPVARSLYGPTRINPASKSPKKPATC